MHLVQHPISGLDIRIQMSKLEKKKAKERTINNVISCSESITTRT